METESEANDDYETDFRVNTASRNYKPKRPEVEIGVV